METGHIADIEAAVSAAAANAETIAVAVLLLVVGIYAIKWLRRAL